MVTNSLKKVETASIGGDNTSQNFGLTSAQFDIMVEALKQGDESLFEHIFDNHFEDCRSYLMRNYSVNSEDAYDITMDTFWDFRLLLIQKNINYGNLRYYVTNAAKNAYLKTLEKQKRNPVEEFVPESIYMPDESTESFDDEQMAALQKALNDLDPYARQLLQWRIVEKKSTKEVADLLGKKANTIDQEKGRCLDKFVKLFFKYYKF